MLDHVHAVEVLLADVVHRPVTRRPQQQDRDDEIDRLAAGDDRFAFGNSLRAKNMPHPVTKADYYRDNEPHLRVWLIPPDICIGGQEHD